ncbi:MAG: hypothetical protein GY815_19870, partial [Gammaproteobacteria bacterium]|nr:hypothetical protein [Gammaproteobacteria bacterium]
EVAEVAETAPEADAAELPDKIGEAIKLTGVFDKPSPFASAPALEVADPQHAQTEEPVRKPPAARLGSAPIPGVASPAAKVEPEPEPKPAPAPETTQKPPVAPLGSAPIPPSQPATPTANIIPPKPPVDIKLTDIQIPEEPAAEPDYDSTLVIKPDAATMGKNQAQNSTDAFITRVEEQLSSPENLPENDEGSFTSTIPQ